MVRISAAANDEHQTSPFPLCVAYIQIIPSLSMAVCLSLDHVVLFSAEVTLLQGFRKKLQHLIFPVPSSKKRNWMNFRDFTLSFKSENALTEAVQLYVKAASFILKRSTHLKTLNIGFYVSTLLYQVWNLNGRAACLNHSSLRFLILHLNFVTVTWDRMPRMRHFQLAFGCPPQSLAACWVSGSAGVAREHHSSFQVRISP